MNFRQVFRLGVFVKGVDGILEAIGGVILFLVKPETIDRVLIFFTMSELVEDPKDIFANYLSNLVGNFSVSTQMFSAAYLMFYGIIKVVLVVSLLKNKQWAYPWAIIFLLTFITYQLYRFSHTLSGTLLVLTVIDILVVTLVWREYSIIKREAN